MQGFCSGEMDHRANKKKQKSCLQNSDTFFRQPCYLTVLCRHWLFCLFSVTDNDQSVSSQTGSCIFKVTNEMWKKPIGASQDKDVYFRFSNLILSQQIFSSSLWALRTALPPVHIKKGLNCHHFYPEKNNFCKYFIVNSFVLFNVLLYIIFCRFLQFLWFLMIKKYFVIKCVDYQHWLSTYS